MRRTDQILEEYRRAQGLTQEKLAELSGVSRPYLAHILTGNKHPHEATLQKLLSALNISEEDKADIYFFEAFRKTPDDFQDQYFFMANKVSKLEKEVERYRKLDGLKKILEDYLEKPLK